MKTLAVITHNYHKKTKSTNILVDELFDDKKYDINYFYISNPEQPGLDEEIVGYDVVVIVQLISLELLSKIKCENIIFIPMYDYSVNWDLSRWIEYINVKILSPTKSLHEKLISMGLKSYYIKYYPEPYEFVPGDLSKVFLWQRLSFINIKTILKLLHNYSISQIHLHKALDPYHEFVKPSSEEVEKYNITFSEWFDTQEQAYTAFKDVGIYVAPRHMEGGASAFIDGMKMGKIVIANDDAAMNEYIEHGKTGFLFKFDKPEALNLDQYDLSTIQKNAYQSVIDGRKAWLRSIPEIQTFILSPQETLLSNKVLINLRNIFQCLHQNKTLLEQQNAALEQQNAALEQQNAALEQQNAALEQQLEKLELEKEQLNITNQHEISELKKDFWYYFGQSSYLKRMKLLIVLIFRKVKLVN